jgi:hypothetical protein
VKTSKEAPKKQIIYERNYRRARERALIRLSKEYPTLYRKYLEEERRRDEATGKAWIDYDFTAGVPILAGTQDERSNSEGRQANGDERKARNLG